MAVSVGAIKATLILQDRMTGPLKKAGMAANAFGRKMTTMGATMSKVGASMQATGMMMSMALTLPLALLAGAAVKTFAQFEQGMNKVRAVTGATGKDFQRLETQAETLGRTTVFSAVQAAEAMGAFGLAGFKVNEIIGAMPGALQLAAAGSLSVGDAASITAKIMRGYGLAIEDVARMNDVLAKAFTTSNTDLIGLGEAFKMAGPVANVAGLQFEETAAALSLMADAGFQGTMGGTALRGAIARLSGAVPAVAKQLRAMGINTMDANKRLLPMADILKQLETRGLSTGEIMQLFGQRAGPAMAALLERGSDALITMTESLEDSGGTAEHIAKVQLEGLMGKWVLFKSAMEGVKIAIGAELAPAMTGLLNKLTALSGYIVNVTVPAFTKLPQPIQQTAIALGGLLLVAGPLVTVFGVLGRGLGPVFTAIGKGSMVFGNLAVRASSAAKAGLFFVKIGARIGAVFNPVTLIIAAVVGGMLLLNKAIKIVTGGSHSLFSYWGDLISIGISLARLLGQRIANAFRLVAEGITWTVGKIKDFVTQFEPLNRVVKGFGNFVKGAFDRVSEFADELKTSANEAKTWAVETEEAYSKSAKGIDIASTSTFGLMLKLTELQDSGKGAAETIEELGERAKSSDPLMRKNAKAILAVVARANELDATGTSLRGSLKKLVGAFNEQAAAAKKVEEELEASKEAARQAAGGYNILSDAAQELWNKVTDQALLGDLKDVRSTFRLMTDEGDDVGRALDDMAAEFDKLAQRGGLLTETELKLVETWKEGTRVSDENAESLKRVQAVMDKVMQVDLKQELEATIAAFEEATEATDLSAVQTEIFGKIFAKLKKEGIELTGAFLEMANAHTTLAKDTDTDTDAQKRFKSITNAIDLAPLRQQAEDLLTKYQLLSVRTDSTSWQFQQLAKEAEGLGEKLGPGGLDPILVRLTGQYTTAEVAQGTLFESVKALSQSFTNMATIAGPSFEGVAKKIGTVIAKIDTAWQSMKTFKTAITDIRDFFKGGGWKSITDTFNNVLGLLSGKNGMGQAASGVGTAMQTAAGVGTTALASTLMPAITGTTVAATGLGTASAATTGVMTAGAGTATASFATLATGIGAAALAAYVGFKLIRGKSASELANRYAARIAAMGPEGARLAALATARKAAVGEWGTGSVEYTGEGMQHGGIVTSPTVKLLGEAGPEAVIPLDQMGNDALLGEMRGLRAELRLLPLHLRDAILLAQ
jgi:TP901 family phage tail tape measure protein